MVGADTGELGADFGGSGDAFDIDGELSAEGSEAAQFLFEVVILGEGGFKIGGFSFVGNHEAGVLESGFDALVEVWFRWNGLTGEASLDALKSPGVGDCGPTDHDSVAPGFGEHTVSIFGSFYIAIADERNRESFAQLLDECPISLAFKALLSESGVESEHLCARILESGGEIGGGEEAVFVSRADFDSNRDFDSVDNRFDNFFSVVGIFEEGSSGTGADDFGHPAAHVDIDDVASESFGDSGGFGHDFWVAAEDLNAEGSLVGVDFHFFVSLDGVVVDGHCADELGEHEPGVGDALANNSKCEVADVFHRGEDERVRDWDIADMECGFCLGRGLHGLGVYFGMNGDLDLGVKKPPSFGLGGLI